jgi:hypothetical protein
MSRDLLARSALAQVPKLLTLLDRNRHSPTYGCFDRNFWHYRITDFPSGMAQELVFPLALVWQCDLPDNPWRGDPSLREWIIAALRFTASSAHRDGSCDDYYPYERAAGAAAFSLLACLEAYRIVELEDPRRSENLREFLARRASWLAHSAEPGAPANHEALIVLCLLLARRLLRTDGWDAAAAARLRRLLDGQDPEGWFPEYGGCDPGYHSLTLSTLAWIRQLVGDGEERGRLDAALDPALALAACFLHPDGSYGGEYGSRNTYGFFPHGFELLGRERPLALAVHDGVLAGLAARRGADFSDDHIVGHHLWSRLLAWRDWVDERPAPWHPGDGRAHFPRAGLVTDRRAGWTLIVATNKGGTFKLFRERELLVSDTQFSLQVRRGGRTRNAVGHLLDDYECRVDADEIVVRGELGWAPHRVAGAAEHLLLRLVMRSVGRFFPRLVRRVLQRLLIVGKSAAPFRFERRLRWNDGAWEVEDRLEARSGWARVDSVALGCDQTSIYVATSRSFQSGQLQPWTLLEERLTGLAADEPLTLRRRPGAARG